MEQFADAIRREDGIPAVDRLLRLKKSYFEAKRATNSEKCNKLGSSDGSSSSDSGRATPTDTSTDGGTKSGSKSKSKSKAETLCSFHADKKYDYGLHAVTLDGTGRCVDPRIISESK